jgi:acyl-CoA reductase-like NAD-dependent aldehyde dehydrogenase
MFIISNLVPDGILNVVCGYGSETGDALCSNKDIAKLDVTGGTETGRKIAAKAGENLIECIAELGGKAPVLVFKDANIQDAVNGAAFAAFIASGQTCVMGSRILVQDSVYDEFLEKFKLKIAKITMGNPLDMKTMMGPVISQQSRIRIHAHVLHALSQGAKLQAGGYIPDMVGHYYPPTCLEVTPDMDVFHKEVFGPVVCITPFSTVSEAIKLANDSEFGLACSIWDQDFKNALSVSQKIDTGIVWINGHHHNDPSSPWGGVKNSGMGRENGQEAYLAYTSSKSIVMNYGPSSDWFGQSESRYG